MTFRLKERPDLRPFFGSLSPDEHEELLNRLLLVDERLGQLAQEATNHVGVPYKAVEITFFPETGLHGGPSGSAGDIWFDVSGPSGRPPWVVESRLVVLCSDSPEPRGDSNCHDLVRLVTTAANAREVVDALEAHVEAMFLEVVRHSPEAIAKTVHADLP